MKRILITWAFMAILIMAGCSSVDDMPQIREDAQEMLPPGHVPREVSCRILNKVLVKANFNTSNGVANLKCLANENDCRAFNAAGEALTRGDEQDARFYVFDIGTEGDYAIMGAHTSVPPLLVLASGATAPDPNEPDEFKKAIVNLPYDLTSLDSLGFSTDPIEPIPMEKYYDYLNAEYTLVGGTEPIKLKWGPHYPWNTQNEIFLQDNDTVIYKANNCSCIAMAMILTNEHYRPASYGNHNFTDWDYISAYTYVGIENIYPELGGGTDEVADLIHFLSQPDLMNVTTWGQHDSWNDPARIPITYNALGYDVVHEYFSLDHLLASVEQGYPVYAEGRIYDEDDDLTLRAHLWVMSAVVEANVPWAYSPVGSPLKPTPDSWNYEEQYLVHHNFGWAGQAQGYYMVASRIRTGADVKISEDFGIVTKTMRKGWGTYGALNMYIDTRVNF